jgi:hypothetical protein
MWFAERVGNGAACRAAARVKWPMTQTRQGVGCLFALTSPTENGFDILEPGSLYPGMLRELND